MCGIFNMENFGNFVTAILYVEMTTGKSATSYFETKSIQVLLT